MDKNSEIFWYYLLQYLFFCFFIPATGVIPLWGWVTTMITLVICWYKVSKHLETYW